jgi:hypothetical protein
MAKSNEDNVSKVVETCIGIQSHNNAYKKQRITLLLHQHLTVLKRRVGLTQRGKTGIK